jgi:hypothetical protein
MGQSGDLAEVRGLISEAFRTTRPEKNGDALLASRFPQLGALPQASEIVAYAIADAALADADRILGHLRENHEAIPPEQADLYWNKVGRALTWAATWKAWRAVDEAFKAARREAVARYEALAPPAPAAPPPSETPYEAPPAPAAPPPSETPYKAPPAPAAPPPSQTPYAAPAPPPEPSSWAEGTPAAPPPSEHTAREDRSRWNASAMTPGERSGSGGPPVTRDRVTATPPPAAPPPSQTPYEAPAPPPEPSSWAEGTPAAPPPSEHTAPEDDPFWGWR